MKPIPIDRFIKLSDVGRRINTMVQEVHQTPYIITHRGVPAVVMIAPSDLDHDQWCMHIRRATQSPPVVTMPLVYATKHCATLMSYPLRWQLVILTRHGNGVALLAHIDIMRIGIDRTVANDPTHRYPIPDGEATIPYLGVESDDSSHCIDGIPRCKRTT